MIAVYAQATGRQGLESSVDGVATENDDPRFSELRERGRAAASANPIQLHGFELRYSRGFLRLVFDDTASGQDGSPITVVVEVDRLKGSLDTAAATAVDGVRAIGRDVDSRAMRDVMEVAAEVHASHVTRRRIIVAGGVVVVAGVVIIAAVLGATALPLR